MECIKLAMKNALDDLIDDYILVGFQDEKEEEMLIVGENAMAAFKEKILGIYNDQIKSLTTNDQPPIDNILSVDYKKALDFISSYGWNENKLKKVDNLLPLIASLMQLYLERYKEQSN